MTDFIQSQTVRTMSRSRLRYEACTRFDISPAVAQEFTFDDAAAIAEYLKALGISHVYSSPYLQAAPGSMHGYDVVDHRKVNEELGGAEAHERFCRRLGEAGLGQVLDIVPNHMSLGSGEPLLVGCAGERHEQPLCEVLRYRLEPVRGAAAEQGAGADSGGPVWAGAERGRHRGGAARERAFRWRLRDRRCRFRRKPVADSGQGGGVCEVRYAELSECELCAAAVAGLLRTGGRFWRGIGTRRCCMDCWIGCATEETECARRSTARCAS